MPFITGDVSSHSNIGNQWIIDFFSKIKFVLCSCFLSTGQSHFWSHLPFSPVATVVTSSDQGQHYNVWPCSVCSFMAIQNMEGFALWQCSVSFYFLFQLFICTTLEEDLKETALYPALWLMVEKAEKCTCSQEIIAVFKLWNRSSRKKRHYTTLGPGYAAGAQHLMCINRCETGCS